MTDEVAIEVIEYINQKWFGNQSQALNRAIEALSVPEREKGEWIPVSERLPKAYQKILVTYEEIHWANEPTTYSVKLISFGGVVDFIAWQPLPEPYKAESETTDRIEYDTDGQAYKYFITNDIPEREKGEWIPLYPNDPDLISYECKSCGEEQPFKWNFCPNCGADMRGKAE